MKLYHSLGQHYNKMAVSISSDGMKLSNAEKFAWADINEIIPNRPVGIFFWGEDNERAIRLADIVVDTDDIDTGKLFGFPAAYASAANAYVSGAELVEGALELLANAQPVSFRDWDGTTLMEWVYVGDIPADKLEIID